MEYISKKGYEMLCQMYYSFDDKIREAQNEMGLSAKRDFDLRENPEFMELRVLTMYTLPAQKQNLFNRIKECVIIEESPFYIEFKGNEVIIGSKIICEIDGEIETYTILGNNESDLKRQIISCSSPLAIALLGKHTNDEVDFNGMKIIIKNIEKYYSV